MNLQSLILGSAIFQALKQCFNPGTWHCQLKSRLTFKIAGFQQKCALGWIDIGIDCEIIGSQLPVSMVRQPVPKFFFENLPAGFETPFGHFSFVFRQGPERQLRQNAGPGGEVAIFRGQDTTIHKSRTIRAARNIGE